MSKRIETPTTAQGTAVFAAGLAIALRETIAHLRQSAPQTMEGAQAATVLAVKTAIADGIPVEDEAAGWRAAIETVIAMYEAEKRRIVRDDEV